MNIRRLLSFIVLCAGLLSLAACAETSHPFSLLAPTTLKTVTTPGFLRHPYADSEYFVHIPSSALKLEQPLQVVMAVHGMNGNGLAFGQTLLDYADTYGLVLVAPTMRYDDNYQDPRTIAANDEVLLPELNNLVDTLPAELHHKVASKIYLFGFSRGAQIVHRFATFYPERVAGLAVMSAGTYTLPTPDYQTANSLTKTSLRFPFGIADLADYTGHKFNLAALRQVRFLVMVGGADTAIKDVPSAWSPYLGTTRLERATRYAGFLRNTGVDVTFKVYPGVGHVVCKEMKQTAFDFFKTGAPNL